MPSKYNSRLRVNFISLQLSLFCFVILSKHGMGEERRGDGYPDRTVLISTAVLTIFLHQGYHQLPTIVTLDFVILSNFVQSK